MARRKKLDYEAAISELESLVTKLEQGDISLEESLKLYENGVLISRDCQEALQQAEKKVSMLVQQMDKTELVEFDPESTES